MSSSYVTSQYINNNLVPYRNYGEYVNSTINIKNVENNIVKMEDEEVDISNRSSSSPNVKSDSEDPFAVPSSYSSREAVQMASFSRFRSQEASSSPSTTYQWAFETLGTGSDETNINRFNVKKELWILIFFNTSDNKAKLLCMTAAYRIYSFICDENQTDLNLDGLGLSDLPKCISLCSDRLKTLSLVSNKFSTIPSVIFNLPKLERLNLQNNQILFFSKDIKWSLPNLKYLSLENNPIISVSEEIYDICYTNLPA